MVGGSTGSMKRNSDFKRKKISHKITSITDPCKQSHHEARRRGATVRAWSSEIIGSNSSLMGGRVLSQYDYPEKNPAYKLLV